MMLNLINMKDNPRRQRSQGLQSREISLGEWSAYLFTCGLTRWRGDGVLYMYISAH